MARCTDAEADFPETLAAIGTTHNKTCVAREQRDYVVPLNCSAEHDPLITDLRNASHFRQEELCGY